MNSLSEEIIAIFKSALKKLTGYKRRAYAAELARTYFNNSARKMERVLGVSREMIALGINEYRTGIRCLDNFSARGSKKKSPSTRL